MPFDDAKINIGSDYNPTTGVFTCRTPGLYHFAYNLIPYTTGSYVDACLQHNGVCVGFVYTSGGTSAYSAYTSVSYSIILELNKGDEVYIYVYGNSYIGGNTDGGSSFNGYLIHEK